MQASDVTVRQFELETDGFVEDALVQPAEIVKGNDALDVLLSRDMTDDSCEVLVLRACESANGTRAIPERAVQVEENRLWPISAWRTFHCEGTFGMASAVFHGSGFQRRSCKLR